MKDYILRRLLLMIPTLIGIITINFFVIQAAPGGPVEQIMAKMEQGSFSAVSRISGGGSGEVVQVQKENNSAYQGERT